MHTVVCDGCWVDGDGPHDCQQRITRPGFDLTCRCEVEQTCASWSTGDVLRSRWDRG